jgi:hypothetical protein
VNRATQLLALGVGGLIVLAANSRALIATASAVTTPIVALGIVAGLLRCVWWFTGPR